MELGEILRALWIHRLVAVIGAPFAIALVLVGTHRITLSPLSLAPPHATVGVATARVFVDTPGSELVDLGQKVGIDPTSLDAMWIRVGVMTDELASDSWRAALARNAGLRPDQIDFSPFGVGPSHTSSLARRLVLTDATGDRTYVIRLSVSQSEPIVTFYTSGPTPQDADRLAQAALTTFSHLVDVNGHKGFVARPLGTPRVGLVATGHGRAMTVIIGFFALCAWLVGIVLAGGIAGSWRRARPIQVAGA